MQPLEKRTKAIIFDLGGVILDIDYQRTVDAFQALGYADFHTQYGKMRQSGLFDRLERGEITPAEFRSELHQALPGVTDRKLDEAWNAIILDFPEGRLDFIRQVKAQRPTFLLSNTNAIHLEHFSRVLEARTGMCHLDAFFHKVYLSHEIGLRKPDPRAFELILEEQELQPEHTLFIDDSPQHVESARALGLQTIHLQSIGELEEVLRPFLA